MKRFLGILMTIIACTLTSYAKEAQAIATFEEESYDFGYIEESGGSVSHEFEFVNTGNGNLLILDATAQCGCTRPQYSKKPVAPGKKGKVKVTFNPTGRPGAFTKTVTIKTNGKPAKVRLKIEGCVVPEKN